MTAPVRERLTPADESLLRRAWWAAALRTSLGLTAVLVLVGAVGYGSTVRAQRIVVDRELAEVAAEVDDLNDPPPGVVLVERRPDGTLETSTGAPPAARAPALLAGPPGLFSADVDGVHYSALLLNRPGGERLLVLRDGRAQEEQRTLLVEGLLAAELAGLGASVVLAVLLSRRAIRPLALALQRQRRFVADASHELRAPLAVLHTRAQLLARAAEHRDELAVARHANGLASDTRSLGEVVEDLLVAAELGGRPGGRQQVDVAALTGQVLASFDAYAGQRRVRLHLEDGHPQGRAAGVVVRAAPAALRRALAALLDNALAHVRPGGSVSVRVARRDGEVRVTVADDGTGLDPALARLLVSRFVRGDAPGEGTRGFGLGLALVREVVRDHGGHMLVDGAPGHGASFTLVLPAVGDGEGVPQAGMRRRHEVAERLRGLGTVRGRR